MKGSSVGLSVWVNSNWLSAKVMFEARKGNKTLNLPHAWKGSHQGGETGGRVMGEVERERRGKREEGKE